MKKVIGILCVFALLIGVASMAMASETDWVMQFRASSSGGSSAATALSLGTKTGAQNGQDSNDATGTYSATGVAYVRSYQADFTNGNMYMSDLRAPITAGTSQSWDIVVWAGGTYSLTSLKLAWWALGSTSDPVGTIGGKAYDYKLEMINDPTGQHSDFVWTSADPTGGTSTAPLDSLVWSAGFPKTDQYGAVDSGIKLRFTVSEHVEDPPDVPEPGSMLALGSGLVGLIGFAIRRRR